MEALYNRAKLLEHGAQSPDIPVAAAATTQHHKQEHVDHGVIVNTHHREGVMLFT